jgi:hypothetical protein
VGEEGRSTVCLLFVFDLCRSKRIPSRITVVVLLQDSRKMVKKRKSEYSGLDEVEKTLHTSFCTAANSISHLYTQAQHQQKHAFQAGERHAVVGEYTFKTSSFFSSQGMAPYSVEGAGLDPNPNPNFGATCLQRICVRLLLSANLRSLLDYAFVGGGVYGLINICKISI